MSNNFRSSTDREADKRTSQLMTQRIHNEFSDIFKGTGSFDGMFSFHVKEGIQPCQALPRRVAYVLQEPLREELE